MYLMSGGMLERSLLRLNNLKLHTSTKTHIYKKLSRTTPAGPTFWSQQPQLNKLGSASHYMCGALPPTPVVVNKTKTMH